MSRRSLTVVLWVFPRRWRARYGPEVRELVADLDKTGRASWSEVADLVRTGVGLRIASWASFLPRLAFTLARNVVMLGLAGSIIFVGIRALTNSPAPGWSPPVNFKVFVKPTASANQRHSIVNTLAHIRGVQQCAYVDQQHSVEEAKRVLAGEPTATAHITAHLTPGYFGCEVTIGSVLPTVAAMFTRGQGGVDGVAYPPTGAKRPIVLASLLIAFGALVYRH